MTREEIKSNLYRSDYIRIALKCSAKGCFTNRQYVYDVVSGRRKALRGKGKFILENALEQAVENIKERQAAINASSETPETTK